MKVPCKYSQITLEKYQEVHPIVKRILEEQDEDKRYSIQLELLEAFGVDHTQLNIGQIAKLIKRLSFLKANTYQLVYKYLWIKGRLYKAENDPEKLNASQYTSIKILCKNDLVKQLHEIAPICYKVFKWKHTYKKDDVLRTKYLSFVYDDSNHKELTKWFKVQKASKMIPLVFFCSKVYEHWITSTTTYLTAMKIIKNRQLEVQELLSDGNFLKYGAGTLQSTK